MTICNLNKEINQYFQRLKKQFNIEEINQYFQRFFYNHFHRFKIYIKVDLVLNYVHSLQKNSIEFRSLREIGKSL